MHLWPILFFCQILDDMEFIRDRVNWDACRKLAITVHSTINPNRPSNLQKAKAKLKELRARVQNFDVQLL